MEKTVLDDWHAMISHTGMGDRDINRIRGWILDELQSRNLNWPPGTGMGVSIHRDLAQQKDVVRIVFHDHQGNYHHVDQLHDMYSLYGYVRVRDETIATIMLLLG